MIETRRYKNVVIFIQIVLSFVLSRKVRRNYFGSLYINNSFSKFKDFRDAASAENECIIGFSSGCCDKSFIQILSIH